MNPEVKAMNSEIAIDPSNQNNSHKFLVLILLTMAQFLVVLDYSIVTVALPSIIKDLGITISLVQWVVTAYGLTMAGFLLLGGRAGDAYGHKSLFLAGLVIFSLSSLASGLAPSIGILIAARAVQGLGAALGSATGLSILVEIFPEGPERNRALGIFGAVMGSGFIMGMISGGVITTFLGWRWVFGVTVPIGLAAAVLSARLIKMPPQASGRERKIPDFAGAITFTAGLMLLVYALTNIQISSSVSLETIELLGLSSAIFLAFVGIERNTKSPILPLSFIRRRTVLAANLVALMTLAAFIGSIFLLTVYLQQTLGFSPLYAGLAFAPSGFVFFVVSGFVAARFVNRMGVRISLILGEGLSLVGYAVLTQVSTGQDYFTLVLPATIAIALGIGFAFPAYNIAALMGAKSGEEGLASGLINTSRMVGGPIGIAALVTAASLFDPVRAGVQSSIAGLQTGLDGAFVVGAVFAAVAVFLSVSIQSKRKTRAETMTTDPVQL
jgi:EmrB/QacA subfamily drug resistance transporter